MLSLHVCCFYWRQERERLLLIEKQRAVPDNHWEEKVEEQDIESSLPKWLLKELLYSVGHPYVTGRQHHVVYK